MRITIETWIGTKFFEKHFVGEEIKVSIHFNY